jgi:hypothetical protein
MWEEKKLSAPKMSENSPERGKIMKDALQSKKKQAKYLNNLIEKTFDKVKKKVLEMNDICMLTADNSIKVVFCHLPVMITPVMSCGSMYRHNMCTKHSHLQELSYKNSYTAKRTILQPHYEYFHQ